MHMALLQRNCCFALFITALKQGCQSCKVISDCPRYSLGTEAKQPTSGTRWLTSPEEPLSQNWLQVKFWTQAPVLNSVELMLIPKAWNWPLTLPLYIHSSLCRVKVFQIFLIGRGKEDKTKFHTMLCTRNYSLWSQNLKVVSIQQNRHVKFEELINSCACKKHREKKIPLLSTFLPSVCISFCMSKDTTIPPHVFKTLPWKKNSPYGLLMWIFYFLIKS